MISYDVGSARKEVMDWFQNKVKLIIRQMMYLIC